MKRYRLKMSICGIFLTIFAALEVFLCVWFFGADYHTFDENARAEVSLPDLADGFVPQGLCEWPTGNGAAFGGYTVAVSGYYKKAPSRVYLLGGEKADYFTVEKDGEALKTHFGGIAATENSIYLTSDNEILRIPLAKAVAAAGAGGSVEVSDALDTGMGLAFCSVSEGKLYAGEFYRAGNYETDESHHIAYMGVENRALVYRYALSDSADRIVESETPEAVFSIRGLVQGIAAEGGDVYFSCSWGLADSTLERHEMPASPIGTFDVNGAAVPLYFFGKETLRTSRKMPCMSEGIFLKEGRLHVLFESACNKYKYFVRRRMTEIISLPADYFA